jgi:hypothetical protein
MRIYEFDILEDQEWTLPLESRDYEVFRSFDGTPRHPGWTPIRVFLLKQEGGQQFQYSDFPWLAGHAPVLRQPAVEVLGATLTKYGELLPLACDEAELHVFNACTVIDALKVDASDIVYGTAAGDIITVQSYAFDPRIIDRRQVFKVPELARRTLFMTQDVVELVQNSGLRRVGFRLLWQSDTEYESHDGGAATTDDSAPRSSEK